MNPPYFRTEQMGSMSYASYLHHEKEPIVAMFAFDAIGYYSDEKGSQSYPLPFSLLYPNTANFIGFVGNMKSKSLIKTSLGVFREQVQFPSEGISAPAWILGIDFSNHLSFYRFDYPAVMITDTAFNRNKNYHQPTDKIKTLNFVKMAQLTDELERMFRTLYH